MFQNIFSQNGKKLPCKKFTIYNHHLSLMSITHSSSCGLKWCRLCEIVEVIDLSAHLGTKKWSTERKMSIGCKIIYSLHYEHPPTHPPTHPRDDVLGKTFGWLIIYLLFGFSAPHTDSMWLSRNNNNNVAVST
jgi:hypothetical protein